MRRTAQLLQLKHLAKNEKLGRIKKKNNKVQVYKILFLNVTNGLLPALRICLQAYKPRWTSRLLLVTKGR